MTRLVVTDHAVLRYLERGQGLDVDAIRAVIRASCERAMDAAAPHGLGLQGGTVIALGVKFTIVEGTIVTAHPRGAHVLPRLGRPRGGER